MNTSSLGRAAETVTADYLRARGFEIIDTNWRQKVCEIDIIAKKQKVVYFVEVKYRSKPNQGNGLEYITPQKLKQMEFAAELWTAVNNWTGDYRLLAVDVKADKLQPVVSELIEVN